MSHKSLPLFAAVFWPESVTQPDPDQAKATNYRQGGFNAAVF